MIGVFFDTNFKAQAAQHLERKFPKKALEAAEKAALVAAKNEALSLYRKTVATWETVPKFTAVKTAGGYVIYVSDIRYVYLDRGTRVRYATMTPDFRAKTKVGVLYSYKGAGRVAYVNTKKPRPGIAARQWSLEIYQRVGVIIRQTWRAKMKAAWKF